MNVRNTKLALWSTALLLPLAGIVVLWVGWFAPLPADRPVAAPIGPVPATTTQSTPASPGRLNLAQLQQLCSKDLRRPLTDRGGAAGPQATSLTLQLVGTVVEKGHSFAILKKGDGTITFCALGDSVDDAVGPVVVTDIDSDGINVRYAGAVKRLSPPPARNALEGITP